MEASAALFGDNDALYRLSGSNVKFSIYEDACHA